MLVRTQYYFRPIAHGHDAWDVSRLMSLSADLPVVEVPVNDITELDTVHWFGADGSAMTVRVMIGHVRRFHAVDTSIPVIFDSEGHLMDGMHRVVRAILDGRTAVPAVRFAYDVEPDYRDLQPDQIAALASLVDPN